MNILEAEINKKTYIKILIISIIVIFLLIIISYINFLTPKKFVLDEDTIRTKDNMNTHIDILENGGIKEEIAGWAYKENDINRIINSNYVIEHIDSGKMYILNTKAEENINVPEEYDNSGLHTRFLLLGLEKGKYEIYVLFKNNNNNYLVDTDIWFENN